MEKLIATKSLGGGEKKGDVEIYSEGPLDKDSFLKHHSKGHGELKKGLGAEEKRERKEHSRVASSSAEERGSANRSIIQGGLRERWTFRETFARVNKRKMAGKGGTKTL